MRSLFLSARIVLFFAVVAGYALVPATLHAQKAAPRWFVPGRYWFADKQGAPAMATTRDYVFVMERGVLCRYDAETLMPHGSVELFGPVPPLPDVPPAPQAGGIEMVPDYDGLSIRLLLPSITVHDNALDIFIGSRFFRVDPQTLIISVDKAVGPQEDFDYAMNYAAPVPDFDGPIAYYVRNGWAASDATLTHAVALNTTDGTVLADRGLPGPLLVGTWPRVQSKVNVQSQYGYPLHPPTQWKATPDAVFVLRGGALAKLDPKTLAPLGVAQLFGPLAPTAEVPDDTPAANTTPADAPLTPAETTNAAASLDRASRMLPCSLLNHGKDLIILVGDQLFKVDATTLAVTAKSSLEPVETAIQKRKAQLEAILAGGDPNVVLSGETLWVARGRRLYSVNTTDGKVATVALPDTLLDAPGPAAKEGVWPAMKPITPKDGDTIHVEGILLPSPNGQTWTLFDESRGEMTLTGDKVGALVEQPNAALGQVMADGVFKAAPAGATDGTIGSLEITGNPWLSTVVGIRGTIGKVHGTGADAWIITTRFGTEYVLTGAKAKDLDKQADASGRQAFVPGHFKPQDAAAPAGVRGYVDATSISLFPSTKELAERADGHTPTVLVDGGASLYAIRNGVVARYDTAAADWKATKDLVPEVTTPETADGAREARLRPAQAALQAGTLEIALGSGPLFALDPVSLEIKKQSDGATKSALATLIVGDTLYGLDATQVSSVKFTDGASVTSLLPPNAAKHVYPPLFGAAK